MTQIPSPYAPAVPRPVVIGGRRPGLVTAIGVASIVVASITLIGSAVEGMYTLFLQNVGQIAANKAYSVTYNAQPATAPAVDGVPTPRDLEQELANEEASLIRRRDAIVELMCNLQELTPNQRDQLTAAVGRFGQEILPAAILEGSAVSPTEVRNWVKRSGVNSADVSAFFRLQSGQLDLYEDRAVFRPSTGGNNLRTSDRDGLTTVGLVHFPHSEKDSKAVQNKGDRFFRSGLRQSDIDQAMQAIETNTMINPPLNAAQTAGLRKELETRIPPLLTRNTAYQPVRRAFPHGDSIQIDFSNGTIEIDGQGKVVHYYSNAIDRITRSPLAGVLQIGELFASILLGGFLMFAGIATLRGSRFGAGFHWVYALLKLPLAVVAGVSMAWVQMELVNGIGRLSNAGAGDSWLTSGVVIAVLAGVYPLILIGVLSTRTAREFYVGR